MLRSVLLCAMAVLAPVSHARSKEALPAIRGRLTDGSSTRANYTHFAYVKAGSEVIGGGTLIAPRWVLSAAQVIASSQNEPGTVDTGVTRLSHDIHVLFAVTLLLPETLQKPWPWLDVDLQIMHPDYTVKGNGSYSDLSLLRLTKPAPSSVTYDGTVYTVAPMRLPDQMEFHLPEGTRLTAIGLLFGNAQGRRWSSLGSTLQNAEVQVDAAGDCAEWENYRAFSSKSICIRDIGLGQPCVSDAGHGLFGDPFRRGSPAVFGVVIKFNSNAGGTYCSIGKNVAVEVLAYRPWINSTMAAFQDFESRDYCNCDDCHPCHSGWIFTAANQA